MSAAPRFSPEVHHIEDASCGLEAFIVLHDRTLGPAAGGIRTREYPSAEAALEDAHQLAEAMTVKCALAGLPAGGGKGVVRLTPDLDRAAAFRTLGDRVEQLGGAFRTAGDLGTTTADLEAMAERTRWVHPEEAELAAAAGEGAVRCMEACARAHGREGLEGVSVAVQGCGAIGSAVARAAAAAGARLWVTDLDLSAARRLAAELGARLTDPETVLGCEVDILAPCAVGGVITPEVADSLQAWALCGAANNIVAGEEADRRLAARGVLHVPDSLASAGAVVDGLGRTLMGLTDRTPLIARLGDVALEVLRRAGRERLPAADVARELAYERISAAR